jgi:hypothetical protein
VKNCNLPTLALTAPPTQSYLLSSDFANRFLSAEFVYGQPRGQILILLHYLTSLCFLVATLKLLNLKFSQIIQDT